MLSLLCVHDSVIHCVVYSHCGFYYILMDEFKLLNKKVLELILRGIERNFFPAKLSIKCIYGSKAT